MKKILTLIILWYIILNVTAQDAKSVFAAKELVWFGLDFTNAKFVGQFDQGVGILPASGYDMKTKWCGAWNDIVASEQPNFDLKKAFRKSNIYYDIKAVNELNSEIDADECMAYNPGAIERKEIDEMVKDYTSDVKKDGIGLVFIVENFNKTTQMGDFYVTLFDIATHHVLICEKLSGKAGGISMRNYWAGSVKSVLKQISSSEYKKWEKKY